MMGLREQVAALINPEQHSHGCHSKHGSSRTGAAGDPVLFLPSLAEPGEGNAPASQQRGVVPLHDPRKTELRQVEQYVAKTSK